MAFVFLSFIYHWINLLTAHLCLKSKRLMLPQESMVCSSRPFLFLIEQMERHSLADLKQVELCFFLASYEYFKTLGG